MHKRPLREWLAEFSRVRRNTRRHIEVGQPLVLLHWWWNLRTTEIKAIFQDAREDRIRLLQGDRCYLCGHPFGVDDMRPSADHVRPRRDGHSLFRNTMIAHIRCNMSKGHRQPRGCELAYLAWINEVVC